MLYLLAGPRDCCGDLDILDATIQEPETALPRSLNGVNSPRESLDRF